MTIAVVQSKSATGLLPFTVTLDDAPTTGNLLIMVNAEGLGGDGGAFPEGSYAVGSAAGWHGVQNNTNVEIQYREVVGGDPDGWAFESHSRPGDSDSARITLIEISGDSLTEWTEGTDDGSSTDVSAPLDLASGSSGQGFLIGIASYSNDGPDATALTDFTLLDDASIDDPDTGAGYAAAIYRIVDPASGSFTIGATLGASADWLMAAGAFIEAPAPTVITPGFWLDVDNDGFADDDNRTADVISVTWNRGGTADLTGGVQPGQATAILKNDDGTYLPENPDGLFFGKLRPGLRMWFGCNSDGTLDEKGDTVYGLFAGILKEIAPIPEAGAGPDWTPTVQMIFEDALGWYSRQQVRVSDSTTRSQRQFREAVLGAIPETLFTLDNETATLPLSGADQTDALSLLTQLNASNGTRHYIHPQQSLTDWYTYVTRNRQYNLGGASIASYDAGAKHVTRMDGWRYSDDTIINYQEATIEPISFPPDRDIVWMYDVATFTVTSAAPFKIIANFSDYVKGPVLSFTSSGSISATLTPFGGSALIEITSGSSGVVSNLRIAGRLVRRALPLTVKAEDPTSEDQVTGYGVRTGVPLSGSLIGAQAAAQGICDAIVFRFAQPKKRPLMTVVNDFPTMLGLELYDIIDVTVAQLSVSAKVMEIVGLTGRANRAAETPDGPLSLYEFDYQLQEATLQEPQEFFTSDVSTSDGPDVLAP